MSRTPVLEQGIMEEAFDFGSASTPGFANFLVRHHISLAVTAFDACRMVVFRVLDGQLDTHMVPALRPLGLVANETSLVLANYSEIVYYQRADKLLTSPTLAQYHSEKADAYFAPVGRHITGYVNLHDLAWCGDELWFVNSRYGCLASIVPGKNFQPRWTPPFVDGVVGNSRYHLNGMAVHQGKARFVSSFVCRETDKGWREMSLERDNVGGIIDVETGQVIIDGLTMPHSPRIYRDGLFICHSAKGRLERFDLKTGKLATVLELPGYVRGMTFFQDYLLVCTSAVRDSEAETKISMSIDRSESFAGLFIVDTKDYSIVEYCRFTGDVTQLYDVQVIPGCTAPLIPGLQDKLITELHYF